jgi:hypothetical protein
MLQDLCSRGDQANMARDATAPGGCRPRPRPRPMLGLRLLLSSKYPQNGSQVAATHGLGDSNGR